MKSLKLWQLIGDEIIDMRYHYIPENKYGLQECHSYIKLASNRIIDIPRSDDDDYKELTPENLSYLVERFDSGQVVNDKFKGRVFNQKIVDFWFRYYDNIPDYEHGYIQLTNGLYLTENNFGPVGLTNITVFTLQEHEFLDVIKEWDTRSFLAMKRAKPL
jgi:hypothetical protein